VFPNPHNLPAEPAKLPVHAAVAGLVHGKFLFPECTVASGNLAMLRTTVPETAINEKRQPTSPKKKIRLAEDFLIPAPASYPVAAE